MQHRHLKRLERVWMTNPRYFITVCVNGRRPVLAQDAVVELLHSEWQSAFDRHGWAIGSYVVMPDHVHFFCTDGEQGTHLSGFVGKWKEWTSKRVRREVGIEGFSWQKGFFDHLLRSDESYSEKWEYVRRNPVRAGMVSCVDEWPYWGFVDYR